MINELYHYGVKGMEWGKRKKSYYDGSGSPFSKFNRTTQKVYHDKDGTAQVVKDNVPSRPKTSKTGHHNHGGNKPLQKGKGLYKKGSGLGTGPVGPGYSKNNYNGKSNNPPVILNNSSKPTSNSAYLAYKKKQLENDRSNWKLAPGAAKYMASNNAKNAKDAAKRAKGLEQDKNKQAVLAKQMVSSTKGAIINKFNLKPQTEAQKHASANQKAKENRAKSAKANSAKLTSALKKTFKSVKPNTVAKAKLSVNKVLSSGKSYAKKAASSVKFKLTPVKGNRGVIKKAFGKAKPSLSTNNGVVYSFAYRKRG